MLIRKQFNWSLVGQLRNAEGHIVADETMFLTILEIKETRLKWSQGRVTVL